MARRLSIALVVFCCGMFPLATPISAQDAAKGTPILFLERNAKPPLQKSGALVSIDNSKATGFESKKGIVVEFEKDCFKKYDLSEVRQIHFAGKKKPNDTVHLNGAKTPIVVGKVLSSFWIKEDGEAGTALLKRDQLQSIFFVPEPATKAPDGKGPMKVRCAADILYPFWDAPQVFAIGKGRMSDGKMGKDKDKCCDLPKFCSLKECADKEKIRTISKPFEHSASFPQVGYGPDGCEVDLPGAIIYEGMQFVAADDGRFELVFNASTPRVPVTMRLALTVYFPDKKSIRLTIPAIELAPEYRSGDEELGMYSMRGNNYQQNWHVRHVGYSPALAENLAQVADAKALGVSRSGTARFGSLPLSR